MKVYELAHSRAGDKGDYSVISVIAYRPEDYDRIERALTPEVVREKFREIVSGEIVRYEVPKLGGLIFNMQHALGGGVTRSLALDAHGKTLSSVMLDIDLPETEG